MRLLPVLMATMVAAGGCWSGRYNGEMKRRMLAHGDPSHEDRVIARGGRE